MATVLALPDDCLVGTIAGGPGCRGSGSRLSPVRGVWDAARPSASWRRFVLTAGGFIRQLLDLWRSVRSGLVKGDQVPLPTVVEVASCQHRSARLPEASCMDRGGYPHRRSHAWSCLRLPSRVRRQAASIYSPGLSGILHLFPSVGPWCPIATWCVGPPTCGLWSWLPAAGSYAALPATSVAFFSR